MSSSQGIAKNTMFLYIRMFLTLLVTLYTSRVVLKALGVSDYGLYSIVGGVVSMFGFFNMAMASATQRFLSFEIGAKNFIKLNKTFVTSINIHIGIALLVIVLAETFGLWFVNNKLNVDPNRIFVLNWVYQFSILSLCIKIIQVPYNALVIAREKMNIYAVLSVIEVVLKLLAVFVLLKVHDFDKLKLYSILVFVVTFFIGLFYRIYCVRHFTESKYKYFYDKDLYKELMSFSGWSLFGNLAAVARGQGSNILLNIFFGTVVNAAYGISLQVNSAVKQFVSSFQVALNPQIIKTYAKGDFEQNQRLILQGSKFSFFLLFIIMCPIWIHINFVLDLWLVNPPELTSVFVRLAMISLLIDSISGSIMIGIQATGKIKMYQIIIGTTILLDMPITYLVLSVWDRPEYSFFVTIGITFSTLFLRFFFLKKLINIRVVDFIKNVLFKIILVSSLSILALYIYNNYFEITEKWFSVIFSSIFTLIINISLITLFGFDKAEKILLKRIINEKFFQKNIRR